MRAALCLGGLLVLASVGSSTAAATSFPNTELVSVNSRGRQANGPAGAMSISVHGRYVAFESAATDLAGGDPHYEDVFLRDRKAGTTRLISVSTSGVQGNSASDSPAISANGRYVAFESSASTLAPGDTNGAIDIFLRDRIAKTTRRVSVTSAGHQANGFSFDPAISADGRFVAFGSDASNLVSGDTNGSGDVFVRDCLLGTTERVSIGRDGEQGNQQSVPFLAVSDDGRYIAFLSEASNLVDGDTNGTMDVFVRDRVAGTTERVDVSSSQQQANGQLFGYVSISGDGRYVAFDSGASNLAPGDTNDQFDIFVRDLVAGTTERVSVSSDGAQGDMRSDNPSISDDGRFVTFESQASNLVAGDTNHVQDVFLRDRQLGTTQRISVAPDGTQANGQSGAAVLSGDGLHAGFLSVATNLVAGDRNGWQDAFIRNYG